jgi:D-alanyl-lipoteichoic acid acyltransferase DltB (MBOAT superfamily)
MQVTSFEFLIFFLAVAVVNFLLPKKFRMYWLLASSYYFYMRLAPVYALFLVFSTVVTYAAGILIEKKSDAKNCAAGNRSAAGASCGSHSTTAFASRRLILILCLVINLALLALCKYSVSVMSIFPNSQAFIDSTLSKLIVPVGISFYMLQALGYVIDVYRGTIAAERNLARYALFVSFFPEIMSGPIERAGHMLPQFAAPESFDYEKMRHGLLRMIWGFFLKLVLADRMAIVVNTVYSSPEAYAGFVVVLATVLYTFEIYCDFAGYTEIAIGAAQVLGYEVRENFDCPYLASSVADFWRRWTIYIAVISLILVCGIWGSGYSASNFIYYQF